VPTDCVFCAIAAGHEPASFVHEDDTVIAFMDHQPMNPGGVVVTSREHVPSLSDLPEALGARMFAVAARIQRSVRESGVRCEGINLFLADGECAGQDVFHVHLLVVPRFGGDSVTITCDWPEIRPRDELDRGADAIRQATARLSSPRS
jgi:diadenosine tetraphosphate (Ap4A) HIT family hydrolase